LNENDAIKSLSKSFHDSHIRLQETLNFHALMKSDVENVAEMGFADVFCEQIIRELNVFDSELDDKHDVGMHLFSYGGIEPFHVSSVGYQNPYLIYFYGQLSDGSPVQLIQHVSQISFVLIKMKRSDPEKAKTPIGFRHPEK